MAAARAGPPAPVGNVEPVTGEEMPGGAGSAESGDRPETAGRAACGGVTSSGIGAEPVHALFGRETVSWAKVAVCSSEPGTVTTACEALTIVVWRDSDPVRLVQNTRSPGSRFTPARVKVALRPGAARLGGE